MSSCHLSTRTCALRVLVLLAGVLGPATVLAQPALRPLSTVRSWGYQLGEIDPEEIAGSGFDLVVIDYSRDGSDEQAFTAADVAALKRKSDGSRRIVLAYLSVGEAEDYRFYWTSEWTRRRPGWLGRENPRWKGNYSVNYWDPEWQRLLFGARDAYLDKILRAGFDGVYLDLVDAYESFARTRRTAQAEMVALVGALSRYAKSERAGFHVFSQNGEALVANPDFVAAIDGIAKEELFYGYDGRNAATPASETQFSLEFLRRASKSGKLVLTVDYTADRTTVASIYERSRREGFVPYATHRDLDRLTVNPLDPPGQRPVRPAAAQSLPGQFFAQVAPRGTWRANLFVDTWRESAIADELQGPEQTLTEWTYGVAIGVGVGRGWELGLRLPLVDGRLAAIGLEDRRSRGLGNIGLMASRSWQSDDGGRNVLASIEADLSTDSRSDDFRPGPQARLSITAERYWDRFGVIASGATAYQAADGWTNPDIVGDWSAGIGFQASERLYAAAHVGGERTTIRTEVDAELLLSEDKSVELFVGRDVTGRAGGLFFGVGMNFWIDPKGRTAARTPR